MLAKLHPGIMFIYNILISRVFSHLKNLNYEYYFDFTSLFFSEITSFGGLLKLYGSQAAMLQKNKKEKESEVL